MKKILTISALFLLCVFQSLAASVTLAWDAAPSHTNLSAFILRYGVSSGSYTGSVSVTTNFTSATVSNLASGITYYFVVSALNVAGMESDPSNEVNAGVAVQPPTAFQITSLVTNNSTMVINFSWVIPTNYVARIYGLRGNVEVFSLSNTNVFLAASFTNKQSGSISNLSSAFYRFRALSYSLVSGTSSALTTTEPSSMIYSKPSTPVGFRIISTDTD